MKSFGSSASLKQTGQPVQNFTTVKLNSTRPGTVSPGMVKGKSKVVNGSAKRVSAGKNPSQMGGVSLGTTYGKHHVAHRIGR